MDEAVAAAVRSGAEEQDRPGRACDAHWSPLTRLGDLGSLAVVVGTVVPSFLRERVVPEGGHGRDNGPTQSWTHNRIQSDVQIVPTQQYWGGQQLLPLLLLLLGGDAVKGKARACQVIAGQLVLEGQPLIVLILTKYSLNQLK